MSALALRDLLQQEVENLSESAAAEVLDFVLFLKAKRMEEAFLWEQVEATQARRRLHPSDVQTVTADEWEALTTELEIDA